MLYNNLTKLEIIIQQVDINSHLLLSLCHVIAISGDSGSGKSTLSDALCDMFTKNVMKLETDRYHKWERGHSSYQEYTHLHPNANFLEKLEDDVYNLRIGNNIYAVDYDHDSGKFTPEEKISPCNNIVLCGLHTLWSSRLRSMLNIKIYMDTDDELRWKISRDVHKRSKHPDDVKKEIQQRQKDSKIYIETQRNDADIVIHFFLKNNLLQCECIFRRYYNCMMFPITRSKYKYNVDKNSFLQLELKGTPTQFLNVIDIHKDMIPKIRNGFYGELQLIIYYYSTRNNMLA